MREIDETDPPQLDADGVDRRGFLEWMTWAGTGLLWTLSGGVPVAMTMPRGAGGTRRQARQPDALATLREAIAKIKTLPAKPSFMIHTGDSSHLSKDNEFDDANEMIKEAGIPVFFAPGEHDLLDEGQGASYPGRFGKDAQGAGWFSFDSQGIH